MDFRSYNYNLCKYEFYNYFEILFKWNYEINNVNVNMIL